MDFNLLEKRLLTMVKLEIMSMLKYLLINRVNNNEYTLNYVKQYSLV